MSYDFTGGQNSRLKTIQFLLRDTNDGYCDPMSRPYTVEGGSHAANRLCELTQQGRIFSPTSLESTACGILRPTMTAENAISIVHGWGQRRYMFVLTIATRNATRETATRTLMGYLESTEAVTKSFINSGKYFVADDARIYFNSEIGVKQNKVTYSTQGAHTQVSVDRSNHIVPNRVQSNASTWGDQYATSLLTPTNIFGGHDGAIQQRLQAAQEQLGYDEDAYIIDASTQLNSGAELVNRSYNTPGQYMSDVLSPYALALQENTANHNKDIALNHAYSNALSTSDVMSNDADVWEIICTYSQFRLNGYITWGELRSLCGGIEDVMYVADRSGKDAPIDLRNYTLSWNGSDPITQIATMLVEGVPSMMSSNGIARLCVTCNNYTFDGKWVVAITAPPSGLSTAFNDEYILTNATRIMRVMEDHYLPGVFGSYTGSVNIECELYMDTKLEISIPDLSPDVQPFTFATFADGMASLVVTDNANTASAFSNQMVDFLGNVYPVNATRGVTQGWNGNNRPVFAGFGNDTPAISGQSISQGGIITSAY